MLIYLNHIKKEVEKIQYAPDKQGAFINTFYKFHTNGSFDLKGQLGIPKPGEWGMFYGRLVPNSYLSNMAFGYACAVNKMTIGQSLMSAQLFSLKDQKWYDQPEDQAAVESGWQYAKTGNPWISGRLNSIDYHYIKSNNPFYYQMKTISREGYAAWKLINELYGF